MTLRDLRKQMNKTVTEVATVLGVTASAVRHYESGIRRISLEQVLILAKLYDCSAEDIITAQLIV